MRAEFDRIYIETRPRLTRFLAGALRDPYEREECFQEAYLRLWRQCARSIPERPAAWLVVVARRIAAERSRRAAPAPLDETLAGPDRTPAGLEVAELLDCLGPKRRETFCLRHYGGLSYAEIAEELAVPIGTVASRIHDSLELLRRRLVGELQPEERR